MKKLVFIGMLVVSLYAHSVSYYEKQIQNCNEQQIRVAEFISYNAKQYNLKYTFLAIAFKESQWGKYKLNLQDPSAGLFHKLLPYYCMELHLKPNKWNESRLAEKLIKNDGEAFMVALSDFQRNYKHFKFLGKNSNLSWRYAIQAYNAGVSNYKAGKGYYREVVKIIKALRNLGY